MQKGILIILLTTLILGCTEVMVELPGKTIATIGKVILVEDVTGVDCSNCPRAAAKLEEIAEEFQGSVIVLGIHGKQQAAPIPDKSKYDFRNEDAAKLEEYLKPWAGKPAAIFNRRQFDNEENFGISLISKFQPRIEELLKEPKTLDIEPSKEYNEETRELTINVDVIPLIDLTGDFFITVLISESHINDYQLDADYEGGGYNPEYEHNHVLRDVITNTIGDELASTLNKNELITKNWTYTIPDSDGGLWKVENLDIVVMIADLSNGSKEILQAASIKVVD